MFSAKKKNPYVVFLSSQGMIWGGEALKTVIPVQFAHDVVKDLEIVNPKGLENQLFSLIEQNNIHASSIIFILGEDLYFSQDFAVTAEEEMKSYLSIIPFDEVVSKRLQTQNGERLIAMSSEFLNPLVEVFETRGFTVEAVSPNIVLGESLKNPDQFTPEVIANILQSIETVRLYSLYTPPKEPDTITGFRDSEGKIFNPRLIFMIFFFVVLIGFLVVLLYTNGYLGNKPKPAAKPPAPASKESQTQVPSSKQTEVTPTLASESAQASSSASVGQLKKEIKIEVLNGTSTTGFADKIKTALTDHGYEQVSVGNTTTVAQKTLMLHTSKVTSDIVEDLISQLKNQDVSVSVQKNDELSDVDVRILLGQ